MKKIKAGEVIYAKTNAELLNGLLGEMLLMPRLDGKVRAGWTNTMQNEKIIEKYVGGHPYPNNFYDGVNVKRRVVFEKCDAGRYFIFRGVFELEQGSTCTYRVLRPIKDEILL